VFARHYQTIWLLAQGHTIAEVAEITCFVPRWIEELLARYNAFGPNALGDLRRNNGASPSVLRPELLAKLKLRLLDPPPDGGIWTSGKVACWMAAELGVVEVAAQRGWEALKAVAWSIQSPRPKNPKAATPQEEETFKKSSQQPLLRKPRSIPTADRNLGDGRTSSRLKTDPAPGLAPVGDRPTALGHHRHEWFYVTAFVAPASGETVWFLSNGLDKPFFAKLLEAFARETGAGRDRIIVLQLDNAGWHTPENLLVPDGIRLVLPATSHPRTSARRTSLATHRRAARQQTLRNDRTSRRRNR
jgi:transposase